jgi:hypothetical protein
LMDYAEDVLKSAYHQGLRRFYFFKWSWWKQTIRIPIIGTMQ